MFNFDVIFSAPALVVSECRATKVENPPAFRRRWAQIAASVAEKANEHYCAFCGEIRIASSNYACIVTTRTSTNRLEIALEK